MVWNWELNPATTEGGAIVQYISLFAVKYDCKTGKQTIVIDRNITELIPVNTSSRGPNDLWSFSEQPECTRGWGFYVGEAYFLEGLRDASRSFQRNSIPGLGTGVAREGRIGFDHPASKTSSSSNRVVTFEWNCCSGKAKTEVSQSGG